MDVLIVQSEEGLGAIWERHLERQGMRVSRAASDQEANALLDTAVFDIIVLDLVLKNGGALAVADYAYFRQPEARVVFVTNSSFFSDGSIFAHSPNARAFLPSTTAPEDLAMMIEHYGSE